MQLMYFRHKLREVGVRVRVKGGAAAGKCPETLPSRTELVPELSTPVLHRITLRLPQDEVRIGQELLRDQHQHTRAVRVPCPQHLPAPEGGGGAHVSISRTCGGGSHVSVTRHMSHVTLLSHGTVTLHRRHKSHGERHDTRHTYW